MPVFVGLGAAALGGITSAYSARRKQSFEQRMSDTSHQREVQDLRAAGLNPILSANKGASTPQGSNFALPDVAGSVASAQQARTAKEQERLVRYQADIEAPKAAAGRKAAELIEGGVSALEGGSSAAAQFVADVVGRALPEKPAVRIREAETGGSSPEGLQTVIRERMKANREGRPSVTVGTKEFVQSVKRKSEGMRIPLRSTAKQFWNYMTGKSGR